MTLPAPYAPLVSGGEGLDRYPADPSVLGGRMAQIYGVAADQILPIRGLTHGLELVWRLAAQAGQGVQAPDAEPYARLHAIYARPGKGEPAVVIIRALGSPEAVAEMAERVAPALLVVDEGLIEFAETPSAATVIGDHANLIVLRSLSLAYGLAGARVGAALAQPQTLARLAAVLEPYALPEPLVRLAQQALDPSRMLETAERIATVNRERARIAREVARLMTVEGGVGPILMARPEDLDGALASLARYGVAADRSGDRLRLPISIKPEVNDRLLAALGLTPPKHRPAASVRPCETPRRRALSAPSIWTRPGRSRSTPASASSTTCWNRSRPTAASRCGCRARATCTPIRTTRSKTAPSPSVRP